MSKIASIVAWMVRRQFGSRFFDGAYAAEQVRLAVRDEQIEAWFPDLNRQPYSS